MSEPLYTTEINTVSYPEWNALLPGFADATLYQTWDYGAVRWGEAHLQHVVVKKDTVPVALCQVTIKKMPIVNFGIAFVSWGPLWRVRDETRDLDHFTAVVRALKREYGDRRGLLVRIDPCDCAAQSADILGLLESEGFKRTSRKCYTSIMMDLSHDLDPIRKEMDPKWRNKLNKAEKNGLTIEERTDPGAFELFLSLSSEMIGRKKFVPGVDYNEFKRVFERLPPELNMRVLLCKKDDEPVSIAIYTKIGERAIYILGATGNNGLALNGSNLIHWEIIKRLKAVGCTFYDLGGVNPETNPGVFSYKKGLSGKNGVEFSHIGEHEYCSSAATRFSMGMLEKIRRFVKNRR